MKEINNKKTKREYTKPVLEKIQIDKEISLVMASPTPPGDPGDAW